MPELTKKQQAVAAATTFKTDMVNVSATTRREHTGFPAGLDIQILRVQQPRFNVGVGCTGPDGFYAYCETMAEFTDLFTCSDDALIRVAALFVRNPAQIR